MTDREQRLAFTLEEITDSTTVRRLEFEDADFETVFRSFEQHLDEPHRFASFEDAVWSTRSVREPSTDSTRSEGRLSVSFGRSAEQRALEYKPYGPHGAMAMVIGAVFALPTLFVSLLLVAAGYALYRVERPGSVPLERVTTVDVVLTEDETGASEHTNTTSKTADSTVVRALVAVEQGYAVDTERLSAIEWPLRKAILAHVRNWKQLALEGEPRRETGEDAFFDYLNMCWNRNLEADLEAITAAQRDVFAARNRRESYAAQLRDEQDPDSDERSEPDAELDAILEELRSN